MCLMRDEIFKEPETLAMRGTMMNVLFARPVSMSSLNRSFSLQFLGPVFPDAQMILVTVAMEMI